MKKMSYHGGVFGLCAILLVAVVVLRIVSGSGGVAPVPPMFNEALTLETALAQSSESGEPVFAFFTADWCGPCQLFKRDALADDEVTAVVSARTIPVYIDGDQHPELVERYGVRAFPTVMLLRDGQVTGAYEGVMSAAALMAWLEKTAAE